MAEGSAPLRRLVTITVSHYCEKARWALDRAGLPYVEDGHFPNAHYLASFRIARSPRLPALVEDGRVINDSTAILRHADSLAAAEQRLFPDRLNGDEVERLEDHFDEVLGPATRIWAWWHWFGRAREMLPYAGQGAPAFERALAPGLVGLMTQMTAWRFGIDATSAAAALATIDRLFDDIDDLVGDGRSYLAGGRFTAADLTFAALAAPVLLPPDYGIPMPGLADAPPAMQAEVERLRARPAGAFALRLYRDERGGPARARAA